MWKLSRVNSTTRSDFGIDREEKSAADCDPLFEFISDGEPDVRTYTYRNSICSFVAITEPNCSSWHPSFRLSVEIPLANLAFFIFFSFYLCNASPARFSSSSADRLHRTTANMKNKR